MFDWPYILIDKIYRYDIFIAIVNYLGLNLGLSNRERGLVGRT